MPEYENPVYEGSCPDPFVLRFNGVYYAYGTGEAGDGHLFPTFSSPDLVTWIEHGGSLPPLPDPGACEYWAPEIAYHNGIFYMYFSVIGFGTEEHHLRLATSTHPLGPWQDQGLNLTPDEIFAIDAHPFQDADGSWYLYYARDWLEPPFTGTGVAVDRLINFHTLAGEPDRVIRPYAEWQLFEKLRAEKGGMDWYTAEGPFVVRRRGRYVCFYSGGRWENPNYGVAHLVAARPATGHGLTGADWEDPDSAESPVVLKTMGPEVIGPGHNSLITAPNGVTPYIVYHGWDTGCTARMMRIDRLRWHRLRPCTDGPTAGKQPAPPRPLFECRFSEGGPDGPGDGWTGRAGKWSARDGAAVSESPATAALPGGRWSHYVLEVNLRISSETAGGGVLLPAGAGVDSGLRVFLEREGRHWVLKTLQHGSPASETITLPGDFAAGAWQRLLLKLNAGRLHVEVAGFARTTAALEGASGPPMLWAGAAGVEFAYCALTPHFEDEFDCAAAAGWDTSAGGDTWVQSRAAMRQEEDGPGRRFAVKGDPMEACERWCEVTPEGPARAGLLLGFKSPEEYAAVLVGAGGTGGLCVEHRSGGKVETEEFPLPLLPPNEPLTLHCETGAGGTRLWINGRRAGTSRLGGAGSTGLITENGRACFHAAGMTWLPE